MLAFISFVGFTALVAILAWWYTRRDDLTNSEGYYLAGRSLTAVFIAGSMMLTNLSTEHLVGLNGLAYRQGFIVMAWEVIAAITIAVFALYFLPKYLKLGIATIPEFLEKRFDKGTLLITSLLFLGCYVISLLPIVLYTGALALESLFQVSHVFGVDKTTALWIMVWGVGILGSIYAIFGGLKAVAVSDTINGVGLLIGGILVTVLGLAYVGDGNAWVGLTEIYHANPDHFNSIGDENSVVPFSTLFTGMIISNLFFWCTNQSIIQRALGAKNLKEGQKGVLLCAFLKLLGPLLIILPGIIAFHIFQGKLDIPDQAYPDLVHLVLPDALVGFFAAVVVGAVLSTFNSALNSSVTLFSRNVYKTQINPNASDIRLVNVGKVVGIILAVVSMIVAPLVANAPDGLYFLIQELQGIFNAPILSVVVVGLLTKRVPPIAAKFGLIFGMLAYIVCSFIIKVDIHFFHLIAILFVINVVVMLIIGRIKPMETAYREEYTKQVDIHPWAYAKAVSLVVTFLSVSMYIFMAHYVPSVVWIGYYCFGAATLLYFLYVFIRQRTQQIQ
ncbi:solute:sodium symporter family transporter [Necropsobacter massiliensis]|uniref:solute:sodium symporter family transporter n=1 Tax=Necropsobacter massiliensis TaxID=1400001 RepID=UPI000596067F|nr:solute:sodium symporter family transporter [Necropsobacter massiliensis]